MEDNIIFQILIFAGIIWVLKAVIDVINKVYFGIDKDGESIASKKIKQSIEISNTHSKWENSIMMSEEKRIRELRSHNWIVFRDRDNSTDNEHIFKYLIYLPNNDGLLEIYLKHNNWELHYLVTDKDYKNYKIDDRLFVSQNLDEAFNIGEKVVTTLDKSPNTNIKSIVYWSK